MDHHGASACGGIGASGGMLAGHIAKLVCSF